MTTETKRPLHAWRDAQGLSQTQAARLVGISQPHWCELERGDKFASAAVARRIEELTGINKDTLLNFGDNEPVGARKR